MCKLYINIVILCLLCNTLYAGSTAVGTTGANYLKMGLGAKAASMGENFTALADDSTAVYWNPAGITRATGREFNFMQMNWFAGISTKTFSGIYPIDKRQFIGGYLMLLDTPTDRETRYDALGGYEETGSSFKSGISVVDIAYAKRLSDKMSLGFGIKTIEETLAGEKSTGLAVDVGFLYKEMLPKIDLGVAVQNISLTKLRTDEEFPRTVAVGMIYRMKHYDRDLNIISDVKLPSDNEPRYGFGLEYWLTEGFAGRVGYNNFNKFSFGLGLKLTAITADYAYVPYEDQDLDIVHRFSVGYKFDAVPEVEDVEAEPELIRNYEFEESTVDTLFDEKEVTETVETTEDIVSELEEVSKNELTGLENNEVSENELDELFEEKKEPSASVEEEEIENVSGDAVSDIDVDEIDF